LIAETARPARSQTFWREPDRQIGYWLLGVALVIALMVVVGGLTRLTESGLSITEWKPITGTLPPLSDSAWAEEFAKYQTIPQFQLVNRDIDLASFKSIYWWEWGHRLLGRLIGLLFAIPAIIFALQGKLKRHDLPRMALLFVLGGAQGALGWWMVQSGLVDRVNVSQYRLAAHLGLALIIYGAILWTAFDRLDRPPRHSRTKSKFAPRGLWLVCGVIALTYGQILMGAIVAGLRAGLLHNTWPLMDGQFAPDALFAPEFNIAALFDDPSLAQFGHRIGAYLVILAVAYVWWFYRQATNLMVRRRVYLVVAAVLLQALLGIWTLLGQVPIPVAAAHQAGSVLLLSSLLWLAHSLRTR
jgi:cytochrome c oxidase assembly protein subunit 15